MEEKGIVPKKRTGEILRDTSASLVAGLTGIGLSDKNDLILSASHIFQGFIKGRFLDQLTSAWKDYVEKGRIKDDYDTTSQHRDCLLELLRFLDNDCPDEVRFQTLKKIFLVAATEKLSNRDSLLPYEYMKLCRSMSSGEITTMLIAYRLFTEKRGVTMGDSNFNHNWVVGVLNESGFEYKELVEMYKIKLIERGILERASYQGIINSNKYNGFTTLGLGLCKYIESYKNEK